MRYFSKCLAVATAAMITGGLLVGCSDITIAGRNGNRYNIGEHGIESSVDTGDYQTTTAEEIEISEEIKSLDISWLRQSVEIRYHDAGSVLISESSDHDLSEKEKMRYKVAGSTLHIAYCDGNYIPNRLEKSLVVTLPKATRLDTFEMAGVSAGLRFDSMDTGSFTFSSTSGGMKCDSLIVDNKIEIGTVSGSVDIRDALQGENLEFSSTSGGLDAKGVSVSGDIEMGTVSGGTSLVLDRMSNIEFASTSGNLKLKVPENASFGVELNSVSGDISTSIPSVRQGDRLVFGDGEYSIEAGTVSGMIYID